ncbi:MAG: hypothetical protein Q9164_005990, partial [Protoblastenia rupestris]
METPNTKTAAIERAIPISHDGSPGHSSPTDSAPEVVPINDTKVEQSRPDSTAPTPAAPANPTREPQKPSYFTYLRTLNFWIVLLLGQILALCITSTNTFSSLLAAQPFSIPAFQTFWNYLLLNLLYTPYTLYRYGPHKYLHHVLLHSSWKYLLLSFLDVQGNYFTVLAYRYTTILSAQLINFWAIVIVVLVSSLFLHVRYHWTQILGILICIGGVGILFASDHLTQGATPAGEVSRGNQLKGDLFALAGATFYGLANVAEEYLVSTSPLYEVIGQLGLFGTLISGTQTGIFDRPAFRSASWSPASKIGGYLTGYTLSLTLFYSLAPILFRMASAAFFNI